MQSEDPRSDGAAMVRLLAEHHVAFPKRVARVRMFFLPTPDHRTELMIIYGEVLQEDSKVPLNTSRDTVLLLGDAAPEAAKAIRDRAIRSMGIKRL